MRLRLTRERRRDVARDEDQRVATGDGATAEAYAFSVRGPALDAYNALGLHDQARIEHALNDLEWTPCPPDAIQLDEAVYAVSRSGYWIVFERDDSRRSLDAWAIEPN